MKKHKSDTIPVLLGGDLNAYSMATALKRGRGLSSIVLARERLAVCDGPEYIDLRVVKDLDDPDVATPYLIDIAREYRGARMILIPCADWYMEMLQYARDALSGHFYFHIPDFEVWRAVSDKASFTAIMDKYGILHPSGVVISSDSEDLTSLCRDLKPPFVVKPSDSTEYFRHKFPGQKKVYFTDTLGECREVARAVYSSGYSGKLLIQERIISVNNKPPQASVLTVYSDKNGSVKAAVRGNVLLEEKWDTSVGNYSAIVTHALTDTDSRIIKMLEGIRYTGISNFDILESDGREYCLELNPRQGRSFDYTRAAGINLANMLLDELEEKEIDPHFLYGDGYWREAGRKTVEENALDKSLLEYAHALEKAGRAISAYDYGKGEGIFHRMYVCVHRKRDAARRKRNRIGEGKNAPI